MLMNELSVRMPRTRPLRVALGSAFLASTFVGALAFAQAPAAAVPAAAVPAATPTPGLAPQPEATVPSVAAPPPPAPAAAPPPPPAPPPSDFPPISVGIWTRTSVAIQGDDPKKLNDIGFDTQFAELNFSGQIHRNVRLATNVIANGLAGTVSIQDAWVGFDFVDELHFWVGQLLVPVDRANKAGPFFAIPWNFLPGVFAVGATRVIVTPNEGTGGRGTGGVLWGDVLGGSLKYYLGAFLSPAANLAPHPLYSGRVSYAFIGKEKPGFGQAACFYGAGDNTAVLSLGGQYQKGGSVGPAPATGAAPTDNYSEVNADLFGEFKLGGAGAFVNGEIDYYHYTGDFRIANDQFSVLAAYASPVIGYGQIQPMLRYQFATGDGVAGGNDRTEAAIDAQVGYLIRQQRLRVIANYQYTKLRNQPGASGDVTGNKIQFAVQAQFF